MRRFPLAFLALGCLTGSTLAQDMPNNRYVDPSPQNLPGSGLSPRGYWSEPGLHGS